MCLIPTEAARKDGKRKTDLLFDPSKPLFPSRLSSWSLPNNPPPEPTLFTPNNPSKAGELSPPSTSLSFPPRPSEPSNIRSYTPLDPRLGPLEEDVCCRTLESRTPPV
jgi:hypothetical protein